MEKSKLAVSVEHIPAHKYLGVWEEKADNYGDFWKYHNCDEVCGFYTLLTKLNIHPQYTNYDTYLS